MDWDDVRLFLGVARGGGLSGAARALRRDPATLGRRIARLESDLGVTLFVKGPGGYRLTEEGSRLMVHAEEAEAAIRSAEDEVRGGLSGAIRIGAPDGCATYLLPPVTAALTAENPDLQIEIVALPRVFDLNRREVDMAIAVSRPSSGRLTVQRIADYHLSLAAHVDYLARHPIAGPGDLERARIIGYVPDMIFDRELDYLGEVGLTRVDLASSSVTVQAAWIARGSGLGIVHDFMLGHMTGVRRVLPDEIRLTRSYWLLRPQGDARAPGLDRFAAELVAGVREEILRAEGSA
ncbi:LysR family transcriptional regulator [Palleronia caenipelagi]|uniref:LysR family transcriptional regulator n=1 Tax=Palleronia caenipelagi TaxID=2489174 RepID=A0A547PXZ4_9RHOB|nr:LysR family transcriptional regulator [Palleronia caenipelagi]TRD18969.1 LysR family transcriptional regulator [Palleronia caenipelagi]